MRLGWWERYESRDSRTVLREAGVKFPGLLTKSPLLAWSITRLSEVNMYKKEFHFKT